jgi:2-polyprenyl-3-methyl-5-hydroxy-6-metoxy-1,4-benzoquinol methylase
MISGVTDPARGVRPNACGGDRVGVPGLTIRDANERYEAEARQGAVIARGHLEHVWGWSSPAGRKRAERRARFLVDAARLGPGIHCLELGAGTGEFTQRLARSGCELDALELSADTARVCQERVGNAVTVLVGNAETGAGLAAQRPYDAIVGVSVLHHLDLAMTFEATFTLLRPGGRFAFSEPNMANPQVWAERHIGVVKRWRHVTEHETAFRIRELRSAFERAGYDVELCEPFEFLHPSTPPSLIGPLQRVERALERTPLRQIAGSVRIAGSRPLSDEYNAYRQVVAEGCA